MTQLFLKLVNMSITASWLVLAVITLRFLLKKAPRSLVCSLWLLVAIRLVCPFSFESAFSLMPEPQQITRETFQAEPVTPSPSVDYVIVNHENTEGEIILSERVMAVNHTGGPFSAIALPWLTGIWLAGLFLLLLYAAESWLRIRRQVAPSICIGGNVWICDHVDSPFILGLLCPRIYLPSTLESRDADFVLAHERAHLKRKDHWWKPLGFLLLSIYWFNPVMWIAYILLCRDIELACDERVVKELGREEKMAYSSALLNCSLPRKTIAACPLAFGEIGVKKRVKHILYYKKPAFWIILISLILCVAAAVGLLTDPAGGIHLYEIDDSRNYSDLFSNTDDVYIVREGEEFPVAYPDNLLHLLDEITVREHPVSRSRAETRDKTNRIHLRGNTWLNFSYNFKTVWIDNGVKPTYTYRVTDPGILRDVFKLLTGELLTATAENVTPTGMTVVFAPKKVYDGKEGSLTEGTYWLERWNGTDWEKMDSLPQVINGRINVSMDVKSQERQQLDWTAVHGNLTVGKYRAGKDFVFHELGIAQTIYAEFTIENLVTPWFDKLLNSGSTYPRTSSTMHIPGVADLLLVFTSGSSTQQEICLYQGSELIPIISGSYIQNVYFTDITGDGTADVCATVKDHDTHLDFIAVYDPVNDLTHTWESNEFISYRITLANDGLVVMEIDSRTGAILVTGLLAIRKNSEGREEILCSAPLGERFDPQINTVECVDIMSRRHICLKSENTVAEIIALLRELAHHVQSAPADLVTQVQGDIYSSPTQITVNYGIGNKILWFSENYSLVWEAGSSQGWWVENPEPIKAFIARVTDGVHTRETSGAPFASADAPWDWCAGVHENAIRSARAFFRLSSNSTAGGYLSTETLGALMDILNRIPKEAFNREAIIETSNFQDLFQPLNGEGSSIALWDNVNGIAAVIRCYSGTPHILLTEEVEKAFGNRTQQFEYLNPTQLWSVQDEALEDFIEMFYRERPAITYPVGGEYDWQDMIRCEWDGFTLYLYLIEGWMYEEYSDKNSTGIRCRPAEAEEGWLYFSWWPEGYSPKETDRYLDESSNWGQYPMVISWPKEVKNGTDFSTYGHIWSYKKTTLDGGDYAVINQGADGWFREYEDQINDILTITDGMTLGTEHTSG